jgi:hypothetical protein
MSHAGAERVIAMNVTVNVERLYSRSYDVALQRGNNHKQAIAYAEWQLFKNLAEVAPKGSYHAGMQAAHWLRECARLGVVT